MGAKLQRPSEAQFFGARLVKGDAALFYEAPSGPLRERICVAFTRRQSA